MCNIALIKFLYHFRKRKQRRNAVKAKKRNVAKNEENLLLTRKQMRRVQGCGRWSVSQKMIGTRSQIASRIPHRRMNEHCSILWQKIFCQKFLDCLQKRSACSGQYQIKEIYLSFFGVSAHVW